MPHHAASFVLYPMSQRTLFLTNLSSHFLRRSHPPDGCTDVLATCFVNTINRAALWFAAHLGQPTKFETVA
jgi:hypothetical protein